MKVLNLSHEDMNFKCIKCGRQFPRDYAQLVCSCGGLLDVVHDWSNLDIKKSLETYANVPSGVWKYKQLVHQDIPLEQVIMRGEGNTGLYKANQKIILYAGSKNISFKHEGENPTGSFKDRGMTVALSEAKRLGKRKVICASTGNTSSSLAAYAAYGELEAIVVIPKGKVAFGKLAQAIAYGAEVQEIEGNFDDALLKVKELAKANNLYMVNSINPWRLEGQKTIIFELLDQLQWDIPDYIIVPAGNLGNTSAFGKALLEAKELDLINNLPKVISVQATGANPFFNYWQTKIFHPVEKPNTLATAINIGDPVNIDKAVRTITQTKGSVIQVSDKEILETKVVIDSSGIGCEPASATTLAGIKNLLRDGTMLKTETVVAVLTGHILKDPQIIIDYHSGSIK